MRILATERWVTPVCCLLFGFEAQNTFRFHSFPFRRARRVFLISLEAFRTFSATVAQKKKEKLFKKKKKNHRTGFGHFTRVRLKFVYNRLHLRARAFSVRRGVPVDEKSGILICCGACVDAVTHTLLSLKRISSLHRTQLMLFSTFFILFFFMSTERRFVFEDSASDNVPELFALMEPE